MRRAAFLGAVYCTADFVTIVNRRLAIRTYNPILGVSQAIRKLIVGLATTTLITTFVTRSYLRLDLGCTEELGQFLIRFLGTLFLKEVAAVETASRNR